MSPTHLFFRSNPHNGLLTMNSSPLWELRVISLTLLNFKILFSSLLSPLIFSPSDCRNHLSYSYSTLESIPAFHRASHPLLFTGLYPTARQYWADPRVTEVRRDFAIHNNEQILQENLYYIQVYFFIKGIFHLI